MCGIGYRVLWGHAKEWNVRARWYTYLGVLGILADFLSDWPVCNSAIGEWEFFPLPHLLQHLLFVVSYFLPSWLIKSLYYGLWTFVEIFLSYCFTWELSVLVPGPLVEWLIWISLWFLSSYLFWIVIFCQLRSWKRFTPILWASSSLN